MVTTYFLNCIMGNVFGSKTDPQLPQNYYIGLSTTAPSQDGTGATEPADGSYARVSMDSFSIPNSGVITNSAELAFPDSTTDWGTVTHYVVYDAATNGNLLIYNTLEKPRIVQSESQVRFNAGTITFTLESAT